MKTDRSHSITIKQRFVQAIEVVAKEYYPTKREVDIIKSVGIIPSNFYRMRISDNNYPTLDNCALLCSLYGISEAWLLNGTGTIKIGKENSSPIELLKQAVTAIEADYVKRLN